MRLRQSPISLHHLLLALLITPHPSTAGPHAPISAQAGFTFNELFARYECNGEVCGYYSTLCCTGGAVCYTNAADQAACGSGSGKTAESGGYWTYYTTTYTQTDLQTITSTMSSYIVSSSPAAATATAATCNYALNEVSCGPICCSASQYCANDVTGQCESTEATSSDHYSSWVATRTPSVSSNTASAPVRGTSSAVSVVTRTSSPTTTLPFQTPVATGANITITGNAHSASGLSGGDIAGIVIGVLVGLFLLGLLCFYCCVVGLLDGLLALFGLGSRKRRRTTEVEEYERRSSHRDSSRRNAGAAAGRTWYGARKPARSSSQREKRDSHVARDVIGIGAALAAFWAILGLKRRNDRQAQTRQQQQQMQQRRFGNQNAYSEYSYDSYYDYTSASSASSDDRQTRITRDTRRSMSRR